MLCNASRPDAPGSPISADPSLGLDFKSPPRQCLDAKCREWIRLSPERKCCFRGISQDEEVEEAEKSTDGFQGFIASRFSELRSAGLPDITVEEWLEALPSKDPKGRFPFDCVQNIIGHISWVVDNRMREKSKVLFAFGTLQSPVDQYLWALLVYTSELYVANGTQTPTDEQVSYPFQIYREFNQACRTYAHTQELSPEQVQEWELFRPFAQWLDAAIRALPSIEVVLHRGSSHTAASHKYHLGTIGAWGGCISASGDRFQAVHFVSKESALHAKEGSFFMILSDEARCIRELSEFPEEDEHLHPLDMQLEVCSVLPASVLQMLALRITIITFKRANSHLSLALWSQALKALDFIYESFLSSYIPTQVKEDLQSHVSFDLMKKVEEFIAGPDTHHTMLISARSGIGKTSCALWLGHRVMQNGWLWLFISAASVQDIFSKGALIRYLLVISGLDHDGALHKLQAQPLVLIIDSLDEVRPPFVPLRTSLFQLNHFDKWKVKLILTCRENTIHNYGAILGDHPKVLHLQGFTSVEMQKYIMRRMLMYGAANPQLNKKLTKSKPKVLSVAAAVAAALGASAVLYAELQAEHIMVNLLKWKLFKAYNYPFRLSMAVDLLQARQLHDLQRIAALYEAWMNLKMFGYSRVKKRHGTADDIEVALRHAEALAWHLHVRGVVHDKVGDKGALQWFRRLPLRLNSYDPSCIFSFQHKSIQEYLVAAHLYRELKCQRPMYAKLSSVDLSRNFAVLRFFGELCAGDVPREITKRLFTYILGSRNNSADAICAANSISLLNAAGVSFAGMDLNGICIPGAVLQGANLFSTNLRGALLRGVDFKAAILDHADLRDADLLDITTGGLLTTLDNGPGDVLSVAISADGTLVIAGSDDNMVRIWDQRRGDLLHGLQGHTAPVTSVAISRDGSFVVSGSKDGTVRMWNRATGELLKPFEDHKNAVNSVAISMDCNFIISGSDDQMVLVRKRSNGEVVHAFKGHWAPVTSVAISDDGKFVVSASKDRTIQIWTLETGQMQAVLVGHLGIVNCVAISSGGALIASGSNDKTVKVWHQSTGELKLTLEGHYGAVKGVAISIDNAILVSASADDKLRVWNPFSGELFNTLEGHIWAVNSVVISWDCTFIVSGSSDKTVRLWKQSSEELLNVSEGHMEAVSRVAVSPENNFIVTAGADKLVRVWNSHSGELIRSFEGHTGAVNGVVIAADGDFMVSASADGLVRTWDLSHCKLYENASFRTNSSGRPPSLTMRRSSSTASFNLNLLATLVPSTDEPVSIMEGHTGSVLCVAISPDSTLIVSGSKDKTIIVWDTYEGDIVRTLRDHSGDVYCIAFSRCGTFIVSGSADKTLRKWDPSTGQVQFVLNQHNESVWDVAIAPDSSFIACAAGDALWMWHAVTGDLLHKMEGHTGTTLSVAIAPDITFLASGSADGTLKLWSPWTGNLLATFDGIASFVNAVAISNDGSYIVSGTGDGSVGVWTRKRELYMSAASTDDCEYEKIGMAALWTEKPVLLRRCLREISERSSRTYAKGALLSESTMICKRQRLVLQQCGAVMEQPLEQSEDRSCEIGCSIL